ncbi:MAG: hypothetical protein RLZZ502_73 [Pseudomonadota bacterium]|jgi:hypothetical protein
MKASFICTILVLFFCTLAARAEIYKYTNPDGSIEYTNVPRGKDRPVVLREAVSSLGAKPSGDKPSGAVALPAALSTSKPNTLASKVDPFTQRGRDDIRKRVLANELQSEEKALLDAQTIYAAGKPAPQADETAGGAKYIDRVARLRQSVDTHEKNIAAIKQELANLK